MTIFAGIVSVDRGHAVPHALAAQLRDHLSRFPGDRAELIEGDGFAIAHVDLGLLPGTGKYVDSTGAMTLLAGTLLLHSQSPPASRDNELQLLHEAVRRDDQTLLRDACGTFCAVHHDPRAKRLWLIADSLGLRPLYYALDGGFVFFSTALRVFEAMQLPSKRCDLRGQWQLASLTYTLGGLTPYQGISTLVAGEVVTLNGSELRRFKYLCWDEVPEEKSSEQAFLENLFGAFYQAVKRRLSDQSDAVAYLSGGLDSRCIVACLAQLGADVHTINFAPPGSADFALGSLAAASLKTSHYQFESGPLDFWERMVSSHVAWLRHLDPTRRPAYPSQVWAGYGGETVLAPTNLSSEILGLLRSGDIDQAITAFLRKERVGPPGKLIARSIRQSVRGVLETAVRDDLQLDRAGDPARRLHLLILSNSLRGQLALHHDDMDLRRIEFLMPFFDTRFLRVVLSYPLEELMDHRLYHRWLARFPSATYEVPWQSYPGHQPCPLPLPPGLRVQWEGWFDDTGQRAVVRQVVDAAKRDLANPRFPTAILNREVLWLAIRLTELGFHRYTYLLNKARVFVRYAG